MFEVDDQWKQFLPSFVFSASWDQRLKSDHSCDDETEIRHNHFHLHRDDYDCYGDYDDESDEGLLFQVRIPKGLLRLQDD